ncbi:MAG: dipeptide epimerase [Candidatus Omnitrophica bacterium]|nr:dipeptide epimerase [Candidatus Omnitrophota bacterium]
MSGERIAGLELAPLNLPMRRPFVTALGNKRISRNLLVRLRLEDGTVGIGEASASLAWPSETQAAMAAALRRLEGRLIGASILCFRRLAESAWEAAGEHPTAVGALECALMDAYTRTKGIPLWRFYGAKGRSVTTSLTISAWPGNQAARAASSAQAAGFRRLKVKVTGKNPDGDLRRIASVCEAAPQATLWVDGNQGFTVKEAIGFARLLRRHHFPIRLFEQPVAREDWDGLAQVQKEGGISVAADESARSVSEAGRLIRKRTVRILNIKLAKCGLLGAFKIVRLARRAGMKLMIGCMAESAVGLSASVQFACGTGVFDFVDLDSHLLVVSPPGVPGFETRGARLTVHPTRPGCGAEIASSFRSSQ